jgi:hypothetical protein
MWPAIAEEAATYAQFAGKAMAAGATMKEAGKQWKKYKPIVLGNSKKKKPKHHAPKSNRRTHRATKSRNTPGPSPRSNKSHGGKSMAKKHHKKSRSSNGGGSMSGGSLLTTAGTLVLGGIAATVLSDYAAAATTTGAAKPNLTAIATDRLKALGKLTQPRYLAPIAVGGIIATQKVPMINRGTGKMLGLGMITAAGISAALTPGSPGTPLLGYTTTPTGFGGMVQVNRTYDVHAGRA